MKLLLSIILINEDLTVLLSYVQAEVPVNWCPALGTVLANEEVVDGVSERGGHPVIRKVHLLAYLSLILNPLVIIPSSLFEWFRNLYSVIVY